jgi:hypothetical protein
MKINKIANANLPLRFAVPVTAVAILSIMGVEWRGLYNLDHPKPHKVDCIGCHSDKHALAAMAEKAGDPLYLVHSGQLTVADLNRLSNKPNNATAWKPK